MTNQETAKILHDSLARAMNAQPKDKERISEALYNSAEFLYGVDKHNDSDSVLLLLTICAFRQGDEMLDLLASSIEN
jgi:hypothetical protein